jgi:iron(III) transport system substrate-binding protein
MPVSIVYPDQVSHTDQNTEPQNTEPLGTLFIPNTVALIRGAPNADAARKLIDYLLTPAVEQALALGPSAQIPLNPTVTIESRVATPRTGRPMNVDWNLAADRWEDAMKFLRAEFTGP